MLKQVWTNLIDNAIKFSYENSEIEISIYKIGSDLCVSISNFGKPIPKADREKIFNKFYQVDETYSKSGNGIGLSIVKKIVELHKGEVVLENDELKTIFTVKLPC